MVFGNNPATREFLVVLARRLFGERAFARRALLVKAETEFRIAGLWADREDAPTPSERRADRPRSRGFVMLDYAFSELSRAGRLSHIAHGVWRLA